MIPYREFCVLSAIAIKEVMDVEDLAYMPCFGERWGDISMTEAEDAAVNLFDKQWIFLWSEPISGKEYLRLTSEGKAAFLVERTWWSSCGVFYKFMDNIRKCYYCERETPERHMIWAPNPCLGNKTSYWMCKSCYWASVDDMKLNRREMVF